MQCKFFSFFPKSTSQTLDCHSSEIEDIVWENFACSTGASLCCAENFLFRIGEMHLLLRLLHSIKRYILIWNQKKMTQTWSVSHACSMRCVVIQTWDSEVCLFKCHLCRAQRINGMKTSTSLVHVERIKEKNILKCAVLVRIESVRFIFPFYLCLNSPVNIYIVEISFEIIHHFYNTLALSVSSFFHASHHRNSLSFHICYFKIE